MTLGEIFETAYSLKVFQLWQLQKKLEENWGFLGKAYIKERVKSWLTTQLKYEAVIKVSNNPPIFAFPEFTENWQELIQKQTCSICNTPFIPKNSQEKYCSDSCRAKAEYQQKKEYKKKYLRQRKDLSRKASKKYSKKLQEMTAGTKKGRWSKEELQTLQMAYMQKGKLSKKDLVEIANQLGRSFKSVENKYFSEVKNENKNNSKTN